MELPACPVETTLMLIGDKWKVLILRDLMEGTKRFGELKKSIGTVSQKVLTAQLRDMEDKGLLTRKVYAEVPPRVEYTLTETGYRDRIQSEADTRLHGRVGHGLSAQKRVSAMRSMLPDKDVRVRKIRIPTPHGSIPALILSPRTAPVDATGVLWIHGGGYIVGMKEMVHMSRAVDLVKKFGAVVLSPGYRLAPLSPYPAALDDCYAALIYLKENAAALGVRSDQLMVGGESAGGGLCAAVCIRARDSGEVSVAFQMPLYPMLDDRDTESSRDNHGRVWNTRRNHLAWRLYLRGTDRAQLTPYAAPARLEDFSGLPPAYSFVGDGEPFYAETVSYFEHLRNAGIPAELDVYHTDMHAFDMMQPDSALAVRAAEAFNRQFERAQKQYFAPQRGNGRNSNDT